MSYELPPSLSPLRGWLAARHVDVSAFKSERQVLYFTGRLSGEFIQWPRRGKSCFPELARLQRALCGVGRRSTKRDSANTVPPVRSVSAEVWSEVAARYGTESGFRQ